MSTRARSGSRTAARLGVIGYPIAHSLSPIIHQHWLDAAHILSRYEKLKTAPAALENFLENLRENNFLGINITLPHKQRVFDYAVAHGWEIDESAAACGSVNHVRVGNTICAASTDGAGFLQALEGRSRDGDGDGGRGGDGDRGGVESFPSVMIIGAGGAALAIAAAVVAARAAASAGMKKLYIVNRSAKNAEALAKKISAKGVSTRVLSFDNYAAVLPEVSLLIQASSLGMKGCPPLVFDLNGLPLSALVVDIVYQPHPTDLLRAAAARGNKTLGGLAMLLHQAKLSFENWFDVSPVIDERLRQHVRRFL